MLYTIVLKHFLLQVYHDLAVAAFTLKSVTVVTEQVGYMYFPDMLDSVTFYIQLKNLSENTIAKAVVMETRIGHLLAYMVGYNMQCFWFLFHSAVMNAFILTKGYSPTTTHQFTVKTLHISLADGLIGTYCSHQRYALPGPIRDVCLVSVPPSAKHTRVDSGTSDSGLGSKGHFPIKGPRSKCVFCWNFKGHR